jgi:regulator of cell morphogenesis and NO signaling
MPTLTQSIREIVTTHPSAAAVLQRFDIDLCKQADASLGQACALLQLSVDQVIEKLEAASCDEPGAIPFTAESLPTERLIQHIVREHHKRVRQDLPKLAEMARKIASKRSDRAPELEPLADLVEKLQADMLAHIQKEEQVLFPFISQMAERSVIAYPPAHACFRSVLHPIFMMVQEHELADHVDAKIHRLCHGFELPEWACATQIALFAGLRDFESDLKVHTHLENEILFPRAIQLEAELRAQS